MASSALIKAGIETSKFRLIRFTKKGLEDGLTIHFDDLEGLMVGTDLFRVGNKKP